MPEYLEAGIHDAIPMDRYVADPCPEPSISKGTVRKLVLRSPLHAKLDHPRLSDKPSDDSSRADFGSAAHQGLLGGDMIEVIDAKDWRTKAAKEDRDAARARGSIPILSKDSEAIWAMLKISRARLEDFGAGKTEQTLIWQDGGAWCRTRPDYLSDDRLLAGDYKTTKNADPSEWIRHTLTAQGYDIQAALTLRALEILLGPADREYIFLLQEIEPPYACSRVGAGPQTIELANRKIDAALRIWRGCIGANDWPGYDDRIHWAEPPASAVWDWENRAVAYGGGE
jgi:hypothetical protein